jgi:RNA polymerase sigma-70 factor (ECF subfamily)
MMTTPEDRLKVPALDGAPPPVPTMAVIFRDHAAFVMRVVRRLGVDPGDVEDVTQEVFVLVHQKLAQYDARRPIRPWLFGIASRVAAGQRRRVVSAQVRKGLADPPAAIGADPERALQYSQARQVLERGLARLEQVQREVFVSFDLEGLSMAHVAEIQGCPLQTAYARLHAARRIVQAYVEQEAAKVEV